jgi:hypothetical protein
VIFCNAMMRISVIGKGIFIILSGFLISCKKDKAVATVTPQLKFISITPSTVTEYSNSITITFSYDDLDGDLGQNDANAVNLFVTDSRNGVTYNYRIPQLAPEGANIHIAGRLNTVIKNTAITDNSTSQSVSYSLYVKDRAGHTSNTINTNPIQVIK